MDAERFDSLARVLAAKTPRRAIFRGGAGFGAAWLGLVKLRPSSAASAVQLGRHTLIRQYAVTGKVSDARKALKGLVAEIEKAPGFVDYSVVDAGNGVLVTISIFNDHELELLISGLPEIDVDDLRAHTDYQGKGFG